ncbi:MAG: permease, partial [Smithella sp.]
MAECCNKDNSEKKKINYYIPFVLIPLAVVIYIFLEQGVDFLVYGILNLDKNSHLTESIRFFLYDTPKVFILLTVIVFVVGIIRSYFSPEKTRKALEGKPLFAGNVMAAGLGILTPF